MVRNAVKNKLANKEFFGHPAGLFVLFFTEMWERFSFYGMRALLILYMTKYLLLDPARANDVLGYNELYAFLVKWHGEMTVQQIGSRIYGWYTGLVYSMAFFGGMLADRYLGQNRTVYLGGFLMAIGHFLMASEQAFLLALLFLIVGNGAFKPNISTQVGNLYPEGDPRRDSAFTIFYMGINLGAFLSPLICGTLGQNYGWHWGFGAAGIGMLVGLIVYWAGSGLIPRDSLHAKVHVQDKRPLTTTEWRAVAAIGVLAIVNIFFWAIYEQQGNTLQLWADDKTNWMFAGIQIPSTWFQSINPLLIIMFAPLLNIFWRWQNKRGKEPSSVVKMGMGCMIVGAAFILMILAAKAVPGTEKGSVMWLVGTMVVVTLGELYLSPIGLSLVTKVSPKSIVSMMMGVWFLSSFFGNYASGEIGALYDTMSKDTFFLMLCLMGVGSGLLFFALRRPLERTIGKHV